MDVQPQGLRVCGGGPEFLQFPRDRLRTVRFRVTGGLELDGVRAELLARVELLQLGVDEERDVDAAGLQAVDG